MLAPAFRRIPLAHRALHDTARGRPENSRAAIAAAIRCGYGVELDLQPSADDVAMVFHDATLDRLTGATGPVASCPADMLGGIALRGGSEGIPRLAEVLEMIDGRVPVLLELKDQPGQGAPGRLEAAVARDLRGYAGPVAVMSFNPDMMIEMARLAEHVPRGLVTCAFDPSAWPDMPAPRRDRLRGIADFTRAGASFISHEACDLDSARVADLKSRGATILCWTIRSAEAETAARRVADNITFEGYLPRMPA